MVVSSFIFAIVFSYRRVAEAVNSQEFFSTNESDYDIQQNGPVAVPGMDLQSLLNPALPLPHLFASISDSMALIILGMLSLSIFITLGLLFYHAILGIYQSTRYLVSAKQDEYVLIESSECKKDWSEDASRDIEGVEGVFEQVQLLPYDE
ncbi:hypothetical protein K7432_006713 [Basidiobolus ranarum]|uniref:Uncharacterized protein n=1 Tax=Basidiobolus ranarum TaxID=34480 RepID=A0ABR2W1E7_9FUNG